MNAPARTVERGSGSTGRAGRLFGFSVLAALLTGFLGACDDQSAGRNKCGNGVIDPGEVCDDGNDFDEDGCADCQVSEFLIWEGRCPRVHVADDGSFVLAWSENYWTGPDQPEREFFVYAARAGSGGQAIGEPTVVYEVDYGGQSGPAIAGRGDGSFVLVWRSGSIYEEARILGRLYGTDDQPRGSVLQVYQVEDGNLWGPAVDMADDGRFVVTWAGDGKVLAQRHLENGTADGTGLSIENQPGFDPHWTAVGMADDGRVAVAWHSYHQPDPAVIDSYIFVQRFTAEGQSAGPAMELGRDDFALESPAVSMAENGTYLVAWEGVRREGDQIWDWVVYQQRFAADGTADGSQLQTPVDAQPPYSTCPAVALNSSGASVAAWARYDCQMSQCDSQIIGQRFGGDASPVGNEFRLDTLSPEPVYRDIGPGGHAVKFLSEGRFIVTWCNTTRSGVTGVFAQRFDADGTPRGVASW